MKWNLFRLQGKITAVAALHIHTFTHLFLQDQFKHSIFVLQKYFSNIGNWSNAQYSQNSLHLLLFFKRSPCFNTVDSNVSFKSNVMKERNHATDAPTPFGASRGLSSLYPLARPLNSNTVYKPVVTIICFFLIKKIIILLLLFLLLLLLLLFLLPPPRRLSLAGPTGLWWTIMRQLLMLCDPQNLRVAILALVCNYAKHFA